MKKQKEIQTIMINDIEYVRKDQITEKAKSFDGMEYVLIRTYSAGVHVGYLKRRQGKEVELVKARRIYSWEGAATLSQLAQSGTSKPDNCKFPEEVDELILTEAIEVIKVTEKAKQTIDSVKVWKA